MSVGSKDMDALLLHLAERRKVYSLLRSFFDRQYIATGNSIFLRLADFFEVQRMFYKLVFMSCLRRTKLI